MIQTKDKKKVGKKRAFKISRYARMIVSEHSTEKKKKKKKK